MFNFIRKHQKLALTFIGLVIISFVLFFTDLQPVSSNYDNVDFGSIAGESIEREEFVTAYRETMLRYFLMRGQWMSAQDLLRFGVNAEEEARERLFLIRKMDEMGIQPSKDAMVNWVTSLPIFKDPGDESFRKEYYDQVVSESLPRQGFRKRDFDNFVRHEIGLAQLNSVFGMSGRLTPPGEAAIKYRRENESLKVELAFFSSSKFRSQIQPAPEDVANHYTNNLANYRVPEKLVLKYVEFGPDDYMTPALEQLNEGGELDELIQSTYETRGADSFKKPDGTAMTEEEAKNSIQEEYQTQTATQLASEAAADFSKSLFAITPVVKENLTKAATEVGLEVKSTPSFDSTRGPAGLNLPFDFPQTAFALSDEEPFTLPIVQGNKTYFFAFDRKIPSQIPPLEEVQSQVEQDYIKEEAIAFARKQADEFLPTLSDSESGTFAEKVEAAENVTLAQPESFTTGSTFISGLQGNATTSEVKDAALALEVGGISEVKNTRNGAMIVHLVSREAASEEEVAENIDTQLERLRQTRGFESFDAWLTKEMIEAQVMAPAPPAVEESDTSDASESSDEDTSDESAS